MKITQEIIQNLKPCKNRYNNFTKYYPNFSGNVEDFLSLENITHDDKIWVMTGLMTKEQNVKFAVKCSRSVLHIFEDKYPDDLRPRKSIEAAEKWLSNPTEENRWEARTAADAAYTAADATWTAYAAGWAAARAAASAAASVCSARAAASVCSARAAADVAINAIYAAPNKKQQEELNLIFLKESL